MKSEKLSISSFRLMYDQYCHNGLGDLDMMLHHATGLIEAANAKIAEERQINSELRLHLNRLREAILDIFDQPPAYLGTLPDRPEQE